MRIKQAIISLILMVTMLTAVACQDLGVGEDSSSYVKYFSTIHALSHSGRTARKTAAFIGDINLSTPQEMDAVVPMDTYAYICMRVAEGYDIEIDEFAMFFKGEKSTDTTLQMDFFVASKPPTKLKTDEETSVYLPEDDPAADENQSIYTPPTKDEDEDENTDQTSPTDREGETDENAFENRATLYFTTTVHINGEWNSAHFVFDNGAQPVKAGEYIVIRIKNNLYSAENKKAGYISFTFNYPLFRVVSVNGNTA